MKCIKTKISDTEWEYKKVSNELAQSMLVDGSIVLDREDLSTVPKGKSIFISKNEYKRHS